MKNAVTYSLAPDQKNSEEYYRRVREFTDEVLERASDSLVTSVTEFTEYLRKYKLEELRSDEEYILELLSFGTQRRRRSPWARVRFVEKEKVMKRLSHVLTAATFLFSFAAFPQQRGENYFPISDGAKEECFITIPINRAPAVCAILY